jgi:hypothetical protein
MGNGYVLNLGGRWVRGTTSSTVFLPSLTDFKQALRDTLAYYEHERIKGPRHNVVKRAQRSANRMGGSTRAWQGILTASKSLLTRPNDWFLAQAVSWLLSISDADGVISDHRMSELSRAFEEDGHPGGCDWDKHVAPLLNGLGVVVKPGNYPTLRLSQEPVRDALTEFVEESTNR